MTGCAREILKLLGEDRIAPFQMNDSLANAREGQLAASDFNRQFLAGLGTFASDAGNLFGAGALATKQFERRSNLRKFKVGGGGADDDGVACAIEFDLLAFRAVFCRVQLPAKRQIKNRLRIRQADDSRSRAANGRRKAAAISCTRAGVKIRSKIGAVHAGSVQRDGILHSRESNFPAVLESERDGLPQREPVWILGMSDGCEEPCHCEYKSSDRHQR